MNNWPIEDIPDKDALYHRIHVNFIKQALQDQRIIPGEEIEICPNFFHLQGKDLSAHWSKYATPPKIKDRALVPDKNGIVEFEAGKVRAFQGLVIVHSPSRKHRSHSSVCGHKKQIQTALSRVAQWAIKPDV